jgi:hypothetical protein
MPEQFPEDYLEVAKHELDKEQCLCVGGDKTPACDECKFRKSVAEKLQSNEKQDSEE